MRCARTRALATFSAGRICNPNRHGHVRYHTLHKLGVAARIAPVSRAIRKVIPMHGGGATMILPEGAESTLTENAASPFLAEPAHILLNTPLESDAKIQPVFELDAL